MPSPSKKRKLNDGSKSNALPSRGLEYFFSKQRKTDTHATASPDGERGGDGGSGGSGNSSADRELTDEELARKLQAEWDQEAADAADAAGVRRQDDAAGSGSGSHDYKAPSSTTAQDAPRNGDQLGDGAKQSESLSHRSTPTGTDNKGKGTLSLQSVAATTDTVTESIPFDESPLTFEPSKYIPQLKDQWASDGGNATYALLTRCFVLVNSTASRIKIVDTLVNLVRVLIEGDPDSLLPAVS